MSIQDNDTKAPGQASSGFQAARPGVDPLPVIQSPWAQLGRGNLFSAPIPVRMGSEQYRKLKEKVEEVYKSANDKIGIKVLDLDKSTYKDLAFSAMIVCGSVNGNPKAGIAYHILLLEGTGKKLDNIMDSIPGQPQVEILRTTENAVDRELLEMAAGVVGRAFPNVQTFMVDATVVPESFNIEDQDSIHRLALNAGLAVSQELQMRDPNFTDVNLVVGATRETRLQINIGFSKLQRKDMMGSPMRSDVAVNFVSSRANSGGKNASVNSGDREQTVSEVSGFVDLVPAPIPQIPQQYQYPGMPTMGATQRYAARLVITDLQSNFSYTPGGMLLALATAFEVGSSNNWTQGFRPTATQKGELDLGDIGALNIEANMANEKGEFGTRVDTRSSDFDLKALGQMVGTLVRPGLMVSLDCPVAGPQTWYTSVFAGAASGSAVAQQILYNAANQLSNGNFEKAFPSNGQMFVDQGNRIHLGYWFDRSGMKRDIRDFDHVAACNIFGPSNPKQIQQLAETFLRHDIPLDHRLFKRKQLFSAMSNETAVFTGMADRITFTGAFLNAISASLRATGIPVTVTTPLSAADFNHQRPVGDFVNAALMDPNAVFTPGGFNSAGAGMNYGNFGNHRWG